MTFVLACGIVAVFLAGLIKLWWVNRRVRKHELLDLEKKSRLSEMRKSGIPVGKKMDIPFGVRAIQSGIQVDGIWISRPGTPNSESPKVASSMTFGSDHDTISKGKQKETAGGASEGGSRVTTLAVSEVLPSPRNSQRPSPTETSEEHHGTPPRSPALAPQATYKPKSVPQRPGHQCYNSDSLSKLDGSYVRPHLQTYVPTNPFSSSRPEHAGSSRERTSSSSEESSYQPSVPTHHRMRSQFPDLMRSTTQNERGYVVSPVSDDDRPENPFESPPRDSNRSFARRMEATPASTHEPSQSRPPVVARQPTRPQRSYSGETHANQASRRVNAGFEVLPAGTFGAPNDYQSDEDDGYRYSRPAPNRLHKRPPS